MRGSEGKGKTAEKDAWAAVLGPLPGSGVFGVGSGEPVDLGHVWAEVLPVRVSSGLAWGGGDADAGSIARGGLAAPISGRVCRARRVQAEKEACGVEILNDGEEGEEAVKRTTEALPV